MSHAAKESLCPASPQLTETMWDIPEADPRWEQELCQSFWAESEERLESGVHYLYGGPRIRRQGNVGSAIDRRSPVLSVELPL